MKRSDCVSDAVRVISAFGGITSLTSLTIGFLWGFRSVQKRLNSNGVKSLAMAEGYCGR